jgi:hypothetical protein
MASPDAPALRPVLDELACRGRELLRRGAGKLPRAVLAAGLPAVLARRDFRHFGGQPVPPGLGPRGPALRGLGDRLAVLAAAAASRV